MACYTCVQHGATRCNGTVLVQEHVPKVRDFYSKDCWAHHPKPYADFVDYKTRFWSVRPTFLSVMLEHAMLLCCQEVLMHVCMHHAEQLAEWKAAADELTHASKNKHMFSCELLRATTRKAAVPNIIRPGFLSMELALHAHAAAAVPAPDGNPHFQDEL
eukprot:357663-Chlamydomonas_euryale.AAC.21